MNCFDPFMALRGVGQLWYPDKVEGNTITFKYLPTFTNLGPEELGLVI